MTYLLPAFRDWYCPSCKLQDRAPANVPNRYHNCARLRGLYAPLVPAGVPAKVVAHDREDYVGTERVQTDAAGRPAFMVKVTRDEGEDAIVFPAAAHVTIQT